MIYLQVVVLNAQDYLRLYLKGGRLGGCSRMNQSERKSSVC